MSPFKGPASGSWSTWQLLQLVTNHKTKEPAQGRMLGGPMRGKGGDLGKGRVLGSYKILRPPQSTWFSGAYHFTFSVLSSLQFPELSVPQTIH